MTLAQTARQRLLQKRDGVWWAAAVAWLRQDRPHYSFRATSGTAGSSLPCVTDEVPRAYPQACVAVAQGNSFKQPETDVGQGTPDGGKYSGGGL